MTNNFDGMVTRVAPPLYRISGANWAWIRLSEVAQICNTDAASLWQAFCFDARDAVQKGDGVDWLFAQPSAREDLLYEVKPALNLATGEIASPSELDLVMVPAGWTSKNIFGQAQALYNICLKLLDEDNKLIDLSAEFKALVDGISLDRIKILIGLLMTGQCGAVMSIECLEPADKSALSITFHNGATEVTGVLNLLLGRVRFSGVLFRQLKPST